MAPEHGATARLVYENWHGAFGVDTDADRPWHRLIKAYLDPQRDLQGQENPGDRLRRRRVLLLALSAAASTGPNSRGRLRCHGGEKGPRLGIGTTPVWHLGGIE